MENLFLLWQSTGLYNFQLGQAFMMLVGFLLLFLAIKKDFEPLLLLPIGFGAILSNIPVAGIAEEGGILYYLYFGIKAGFHSFGILTCCSCTFIKCVSFSYGCFS